MTALPSACAALSGFNGVISLAVHITECTTQLGAYGSGNILTCLTSNINAFTTGQSIVDCLTNAFADTCISELPASCESIYTETGLQLAADVPLCVAALGPFAVGDAALCLSTTSIVSTTAGSDIIQCLLNALQLPLNPVTTTTETISVACPTASASATPCAVTLPASCLALAGQTGLGVAADTVVCTADLGVFATGNVLSCVATDVITLSVTGDSIISCLLTALEASCPAALPAACQNLENDTGSIALLVDIPLCVAALGPYAAGSALTCLSTTGLTTSTPGSGIVTCLENALDLEVSGTVSVASL